MSDYLERLALRAAGLKSGRPAAAPDLPLNFGLEAEHPLDAPAMVEMEEDSEGPSSPEPAARRVGHPVGYNAQPAEPRAEPKAMEQQTAPTPAEPRLPSTVRAAPRRAFETPSLPVAAARAPAEPVLPSDFGSWTQAREVSTPAATTDANALALIGVTPAAAPEPAAAVALPRPADAPAREPEVGRRVENLAGRSTIESIRVVAAAPAPTPFEAPALASSTVEVSVHVGRVIVRQEFARALPPPRPVEGPPSAFTGQSLARRHVDRRWY